MREMPTFRRVLAPLALALLTFALALAGCAPRSPVLAKVGKSSITTDDFLEVARTNQGQYAGGADSAKAALLEDLVKRELLLAAGRAHAVMAAPDEARMLAQAKEQSALRALFESVVPPDIAVSDAELQALYRQREQESHARIVFTPDRSAIEAALAEVRRGADFGAVADRFNMTGMTPKGGDLGFKAAGDLPRPVLDSAVVHAPVGQVVGPLESVGDGFFLVQVTERRPRQQEPFDQVKPALQRSIQNAKQRTLLGRWQKELLAQYDVKVVPGAPQILFDRYNAPKDTVDMNGIRVPVPATPSPKEAAQVLVRFKGPGGADSTYTLGDAVRELQDPERRHPNFTMTPEIEAWLTDAVLQKTLRMEVQRRHLADDPKVVRRARNQVDNAILQATYQRLVAGEAAPTAADTLAAYQRHAAQLVGKDGRPMPFEALPPDYLQALGNEAVAFARERRLVVVTDSVRAALKPQVHLERLKRIPWPVPPAGPGA